MDEMTLPRASMWISHYYGDVLESLLTRLDSVDLTAQQQLSILLARKAAAIADCQEYSTEIREDALERSWCVWTASETATPSYFVGENDE